MTSKEKLFVEDSVMPKEPHEEYNFGLNNPFPDP